MPCFSCFTSRKDPVPNVQEAGWAPGLVQRGVENFTPTGTIQPIASHCTNWAIPAHPQHFYSFINVNSYCVLSLYRKHVIRSYACYCCTSKNDYSISFGAETHNYAKLTYSSWRNRNQKQSIIKKKITLLMDFWVPQQEVVPCIVNRKHWLGLWGSEQYCYHTVDMISKDMALPKLPCKVQLLELVGLPTVHYTDRPFCCFVLYINCSGWNQTQNVSECSIKP